jgi:RNA polymerase sigma-70 factor (ECF subfamily)
MNIFLKLRRKIAEPVELADEQLLASYMESDDKELVAILFERYTHLVYGICLNYLKDNDQCKDAVMEIFESLFHKLAVHKVNNFRNWLYSVTRNYCLMEIRKNGSYNKVRDHYLANEENGYQEFITEEDELMYSKAVILSALEQLSPDQGTCIKLMYIEDKSYRDISEITGLSMNEVKSHVQNGKRNLKNFLLKQNGKKEL